MYLSASATTQAGSGITIGELNINVTGSAEEFQTDDYWDSIAEDHIIPALDRASERGINLDSVEALA